MASISVSDPKLGTFDLLIDEDKDKPIWRGKRNGLMCTFYVPKIIGEPKLPAFAIVVIVIDPEELADDNMLFGLFTMETPEMTALDFMLAQIDSMNAARVMAERAISNASLH